MKKKQFNQHFVTYKMPMFFFKCPPPVLCHHPYIPDISSQDK